MMLGLFDKLKAWGAIAAAVFLGVLLVVQTLALHKERAAHQTLQVQVSGERTAWAEERTKAATALATATTQARAKEQALTEAAHQSEEIKNAEIATLATRAADLRNRLRHAEGRAATARLVSGTGATAAPGETAGLRDGLVIPDRVGDGLVRLAERADAVRLQLAACERQYNAAREAMR